MLELVLAQSEGEIARCFPVMSQLRPAFSLPEFIEQVVLQQSQGYNLLMASDKGQVRGVAGFVISTKLAWGKHLYVDDLITDSHARSRGVGKAMIDWLKERALQEKCIEMHLDSGVQRFSAHKFYLRENFVISSHHFTLTL